MAKRKNYPLGGAEAKILAQASLDLSEELDANVPKQSVNNALVSLLENETVYKKVRSYIKKHLKRT